MINLNARAQELFERSRKPAPRLVNSAAASLHLYGVVGQDFTAASVVEALAELENARGPVTVYVNSPGGDFFEGKAIYAALSRFSKSHKVTAVVDGIAASAASFLIAGASRVEMSPGSTMMIHEVHGPAFGRAQDLEARAALIRAENEQLAGLYSKRSGAPVEKVLELLAAETWFTAEQAVEAHFADGIVGESVAKDEHRSGAASRRPAALTQRIQNLRIKHLRSRASASSNPAQAGE